MSCGMIYCYVDIMCFYLADNALFTIRSYVFFFEDKRVVVGNQNSAKRKKQHSVYGEFYQSETGLVRGEEQRFAYLPGNGAAASHKKSSFPHKQFIGENKQVLKANLGRVSGPTSPEDLELPNQRKQSRTTRMRIENIVWNGGVQNKR